MYVTQSCFFANLIAASGEMGAWCDQSRGRGRATATGAYLVRIFQLLKRGSVFPKISFRALGSMVSHGRRGRRRRGASSVGSAPIRIRGHAGHACLISGTHCNRHHELIKLGRREARGIPSRRHAPWSSNSRTRRARRRRRARGQRQGCYASCRPAGGSCRSPPGRRYPISLRSRISLDKLDGNTRVRAATRRKV